jgi:hypothetical protein
VQLDRHVLPANNVVPLEGLRIGSAAASRAGIDSGVDDGA